MIIDVMDPSFFINFILGTQTFYICILGMPILMKIHSQNTITINYVVLKK